jgi:hypothetical protein
MLLEPLTKKPPRYCDSVANRAWHTPFAPDVFSARSHLRLWLDSGNGALIDRRRLYKIAHQAIKVALSLPKTLLKLGIAVAQSTVSVYMVPRRDRAIYSRPKPRRFPLDRGFLRSAQGQSGDEASAGHSLAVARTRYVKGRQALREKYITTGRSIEMVACIMPDGPRSTAAIQSAHPPNFRFVHCSVSLTKLHGLPTFQS